MVRRHGVGEVGRVRRLTAGAVALSTTTAAGVSISPWVLPFLPPQVSVTVILPLAPLK